MLAGSQGFEPAGAFGFRVRRARYVTFFVLTSGTLKNRRYNISIRSNSDLEGALVVSAIAALETKCTRTSWDLETGTGFVSCIVMKSSPSQVHPRQSPPANTTGVASPGACAHSIPPVGTISCPSSGWKVSTQRG